MANDNSGHVVLFGGMNQNSRMLNETWMWDGTNWKQHSPANNPGARQSASMASDASGHVILFGGYPGFGATDLDDTWSWDGENWTQQHPAGNPSARITAALIYHAPGQVLLFGGLGHGVSNETWIYQPGTVNFGSVRLGSRITLTLAYNTHSAVTLAANVKVLTQGAPNLDFAVSGTPTCAGRQAADKFCTVTIAFAPRMPGTRAGEVQILDNAGRLLVTTPIVGQGNRAVPASPPPRRPR
jgi:hypothetical protein